MAWLARLIRREKTIQLPSSDSRRGVEDGHAVGALAAASADPHVTANHAKQAAIVSATCSSQVQERPGRNAIEGEGHELASSAHPHLDETVSVPKARVPQISGGDASQITVSHLIGTASNQADSSRAPLWALEDVIADEPESSEEVVTGEDALPSTRKELEARMLRQGFCPHQINYLVQVYDREALREFASLNRRISRPEDHGPCLKELHCVAYNSPPEKEYKTRHSDNCEDCSWISTPQDALMDIVRTGGVPLISIHESRTGDLSLRIHRRGFWSRYATISHVWADGLGNPTRNALPECQIKNLQKVLAEVIPIEDRPPPIPDDFAEIIKTCERFIFGTKRTKLFWLDTLCIPVGDQNQELRNRCVDSMASIYAGSFGVVVLDKELMDTPMAQHRHDARMLYQIASSVWMCRSWTLQEAKLPQECVFKFSDGFYRPLSYCYRRTRDQPHYAVFKNILDEFLGIENTAYANRAQVKMSSPNADLYKFLSTWNDLIGRNTTQPADLWVVLANCLGFKHRQFRRLSTNEEKMQHILYSFHTLPFSLFFNTGPRLRPTANHHNRWMPTQIGDVILSAESTFEFPGPRISKYSDQGQRLKLNLDSDVQGFLIEDAIPKLKTYVLVTEAATYTVVANLEIPDQLDTTSYNGTCVIFESVVIPPKCSFRGACFYIATGSWYQNDGHHTVPHLEMIYLCPVTVTEHVDHDRGGQAHLAEFTARVLDPSRKELWVKFDPIPAFTSLQRHRPWQKQYSTITDMALYPFATLMIAAIFLVFGMNIYACLYFFGFKVIFREQAEALLGPLSNYFEWEKKSLAKKIRTWVAVILLESGIMGWAAKIVLSLFFCIAYVVRRLQEYIFLYESFDDNTPWDRSVRLAGVILLSLWHATYSTLVLLVRLFWHKREREPTVEEIEV